MRNSRACNTYAQTYDTLTASRVLLSQWYPLDYGIDYEERATRWILPAMIETKNTGAIIACILLAVLTWYGTLYALDKNARVECTTWGAQARELRGWYATDAQRKQCDTVGIPLPQNDY